MATDNQNIRFDLKTSAQKWFTVRPPAGSHTLVQVTDLDPTEQVVVYRQVLDEWVEHDVLIGPTAEVALAPGGPYFVDARQVTVGEGDECPKFNTCIVPGPPPADAGPTFKERLLAALEDPDCAEAVCNLLPTKFGGSALDGTAGEPGLPDFDFKAEFSRLLEDPDCVKAICDALPPEFGGSGLDA